MMLPRRSQLPPWLLACLAALLACDGHTTEPPRPWPSNLARVYQLPAAEGVFAYSRISPDGRYLAYAAESRDIVSGTGRAQTVTVVDLADSTVLFRELGIDAYWSLDDERIIYLSFADPTNRVAIWHRVTGAITRDVAPASLGDYFSWAEREGGQQRILTILGHYFDLSGDQAVLPASVVPSCPDVGVAERPLISKDGERLTTFVGATVVVRNIADCDDIFDTGLPGAKADFSYDGRYIAFHAPNTSGRGFEIQVVDLVDRTVRTVTELSGSSFFPSWTEDGRLSFRYDGDEYRGFVMASDVLDAPARPLPVAAARPQARAGWSDIFPETPEPPGLTLVLVWGTWSAHAPQALAEHQRTQRLFEMANQPVRMLMATDPGSRENDVARLIRVLGVDVQRIPLAPERFVASLAHNQNPTTLLFRDGALVGRRLGAQTFDELREWIDEVGKR